MSVAVPLYFCIQNLEPAMKNQYISKEDITSGVMISDIAEEFGIDLEEAFSGNFNHRCRCPSSEHKNGGERTGSLYIDTVHNNFYCFGCSTGSNCIDFYMLCTGITFGEAVSELRKRVKPGKSSGTFKIPETNNFYILLDISKLFRKTMLEHKDDLRWINELMKYSDTFILDINSNEDQKAKNLLSSIQKRIEQRYGV